MTVAQTSKQTHTPLYSRTSFSKKTGCECLAISRPRGSCPIRRRNDDDCVLPGHSFHASQGPLLPTYRAFATLQSSPITSLTIVANLRLRGIFSCGPNLFPRLVRHRRILIIIFSRDPRPYPHPTPLHTHSTMAGRIRRQVPLLLLLVLVGVAHAFFWGGHKATPAAAVGGRFLPQAPITTTTLSSSPAKCSSNSLYATGGSVMERPAKTPETDSGENKKVFERLFVQLSKETSEVGFVLVIS